MAGNVFRVRALFSEAPPSTMVGMKGTGKIHVKDASLWFIVTDRLLSRWQRLALYFQDGLGKAHVMSSNWRAEVSPSRGIKADGPTIQARSLDLLRSEFARDVGVLHA
jgi:hypothetical protein